MNNILRWLASSIFSLSGLTVSAEVTFTKVDAGAIGADALHCTTVAWGDYDGDGFVDLFAGFYTFFTGSEPSRLYHNNGDSTFTRVLDGGIADDMDPNYAYSAVWVDFENDGDLDLYVTQIQGLSASSPDRLYLNNGDGTFTRAGQDWISVDGSYDAAWGDFDNNGLVDLFVASDGAAVLYYHQPDNTMTQTELGITDTFMAGVSCSDFDNDNDPDLFISAGDLIYRNDGDGVFTADPVPLAGTWVLATADYDNDRDLDLAIAAFRGENNQLFNNNGEGGWSEVPEGIASAEAIGCRTALWGDYDNDGYLDLLIPASTYPGLIHPPSYLMEGPNLLWHNEGDGTFSRVTEGSLVTDLGMSYAGGWADYDNDGDLDVALSDGQTLTSERQQLPAVPVALYRNDGGNENNWINLTLVGTLSNRSAIGAKVFAHANVNGVDLWQMREVSSGQGRSSQSDLRVHFGLGDATVVDMLRIEWPSGAVQVIKNLAANQFLTIEEDLPKWADFPIMEGWADTGSFMGWLYVDRDPWIICSSLGGKYIYCPEDNVTQSGAWVYMTK